MQDGLSVDAVAKAHLLEGDPACDVGKGGAAHRTSTTGMRLQRRVEDITEALPSYREEVLAVEMDGPLREAYEKLEDDIKER